MPTRLKPSAKFIKRCELRVYRYWAVYAVMSPPSSSSSMSKQQSLILLESASAGRYQGELLRKRCKIRYLRAELLSACYSARVQITQSYQKVCAHFATERNLPIARLLMLSDFNLFDLAFQLLNACAQLAAKTYSLDIPCSSPPYPR